jgi:ABC-type nickel/cobalt efflux system permease component RcnA
MGKAAAKPTTTTSAQGDLEQIIASSEQSAAQVALFGSMIGMGVRLAVAIFVPLLIGLKLDSQLSTGTAYTLTAFVIAICLASYMIYREYQRIQSDNQHNTKHTKGRA